MLKDAKGGNAKGILPRARAWPPARPPSASGGASGTLALLQRNSAEFNGLPPTIFEGQTCALKEGKNPCYRIRE